MSNKINQLTSYLLEGDDLMAKQIIDQALTEETKPIVYEKLITRAMYRIGELWELNKISVADEHLATATIDMVLTSYDQQRNDNLESLRQLKKVMLSCIEEEQHYIGIKMVASLFREENWKVRYLGPNMPLHHMRTSAQMWKPDVIVLSVALGYRLPSLDQYVKELHELEHNPIILIGGRMANNYRSSLLTNSDRIIVLSSLSQLTEWIVEGEVGEQNAGTN